MLKDIFEDNFEDNFKDNLNFDFENDLPEVLANILVRIEPNNIFSKSMGKGLLKNVQDKISRHLGS